MHSLILRSIALGLISLPLLLVASTHIDAQDMEAQALQLERQLLCPRCTNVRLDQCELQICADMRSEIREQLKAGATGGDILLFFSNRFGDRVLSDLPRSGFNLVLFGWVGGSILVVVVVGSGTLWQLRRNAKWKLAGLGSATLSETEEHWLDEQIATRSNHPPGDNKGQS